MPKFEEQPASTNRERITKNEASGEDIKKQLQEAMASGDADKIIELGGQMKSLKGQKEEFIDKDREEANLENADKMKRGELKEKGSEKTMYEEASETNKDFDENKVAEEAVKRKAEIAAQEMLQAQQDAAKLAEVRAKISGGKTVAEQLADKSSKPEDLSKYGVYTDEERERVVNTTNAELKTYTDALEKQKGEKSATVENVEPTNDIKEDTKEQPEKTDPRLEKYMGTIRESLNKMKILNDGEEKIRATGKYVSNENMYNLVGHIQNGRDSEGKNIIDVPKKEPGELEYQYIKRVGKSKEEFGELTKDNREIMFALAEVGQIGNSQDGLKNEVSDRLCGDKKFIADVLQAIKNSGKGGYAKGMIWGSVRGEAGSDKDLYLEAVKLNPLNYQFGSNEWKSDPEIQKVALESGLDSMYLYKG